MRIRTVKEKTILRRPENVPGLPGIESKPWPGPGGTLLLIHSVLTLTAVLLSLAWPAFGRLVSSASLTHYVIGAVIMQGGLIMIPTLAIILSARILPVRVLGSKPRAGSMILATTIGIPAAVVFQGINNLMIYALVQSGLKLPAAGGPAAPALFSRPLPVILLIIIVSAILPGISEELMFRGVIYPSLASTGSGMSAMIWQAAAFSLFHGNPLFILPPFLAGLMLAAIRKNSGSLLPPILTHISLNITLAALAPLLPQLTADYVSLGSSDARSLLYASLIAACIAAVALVPLLVLINLPADHGDRDGRFRPFPADWKFGLAFSILIVTMIIESN